MSQDSDVKDAQRVAYYHRCIILSIEFFKEYPDGELLTELFGSLKAALELHGEPWNEKMYTDNVVFHLAFKPGEKKVSFLNSLLQSGLHTHKSTLHLINLFVKLVNTLHLVDVIDVPLPTRSSLHDIAFTISDFHYS